MAKRSLFALSCLPIAVGNIHYALCDENRDASTKKSSIYSFFGRLNTPSTRIYGATYGANNPIEDRLVINEDNKNGLKIGCVFDGHGGWQVSHFVSTQIVQRIDDMMKKCEGSCDDERFYDLELVRLFDDIEKDYKDMVAPSFRLGYGNVAKVGSCATVALVRGKKLIVANAGDCRAVLGSINNPQNSKDVSIFGTRITRDHNCRELPEMLALQFAHPNEEDVVICKNSHACYVKGRLQLTRAIGDLYLKYPEFNGPPKSHRSSGRHIPDPFTPPYVNHRPDVHQINLNGRDRLVLLATDGVWDYLSDQEAISIAYQAGKTNESAAADAVVTAALEVAAKECGMTLAQMKSYHLGIIVDIDMMTQPLLSFGYK